MSPSEVAALVKELRKRPIDMSAASVRSVEVVEPDLEAVFLHLTGTALRE